MPGAAAPGMETGVSEIDSPPVTVAIVTVGAAGAVAAVAASAREESSPEAQKPPTQIGRCGDGGVRRLAPETGAEVRVGGVRGRDDLQRLGPIEPCVSGAIDDAHLAASDLGLD
jgi:hypothetical protein